MEKQLHYAIKEKPQDPFADETDVLYGRYQLVFFDEKFDYSAIEGIEYAKADISGSKYYYMQDSHGPMIREKGIERELTANEKTMKIVCMQKFDFETAFPLLQKILKSGVNYYFRFNKSFSPDLLYFAQMPDQDIPRVELDELYTCIYSNKFDYVYKVV